MTLTLTTRELVGLIGDVLPFVSPDDEDTTWHRVILRYDGTRLHALAGDGLRLAWTSWGPDDSDSPTLPMEWDPLATVDSSGEPWELAILPENAKEIATKFKLTGKLAEAPVRVVGSSDQFRVERDCDPNGNVSLKTVALSRPWDHNAPRIDEVISDIAERAQAGHSRAVVAYSGYALADFCDPKKVRQVGPVVLRFGPASTYLTIGRWFRGAVVQTAVPADAVPGGA
jgi:hypothetical protein